MADEIELSVMIKSAVHEAMTDGALVSPETHEDHHRWIRAQIEKAESCRRNRQRITAHVVGWIAVSFLSAIAFLIWLGFKIVTKGAVPGE